MPSEIFAFGGPRLTGKLAGMRKNSSAEIKTTSERLRSGSTMSVQPSAAGSAATVKKITPRQQRGAARRDGPASRCTARVRR